MTAHAVPHPAGGRFFFWILVVTLAFPVRVDFPIGPFATISVVDVALLACAGFVFLRFVALGSVEPGPPAVAFAVLTPALLALASTLWSADVELAIAGTIKYFYAALVYFVALQFARELSERHLTRACLVLLVGWLLGSLAMYLGVPGFAYFVPDTSGLSEADIAILHASVYTRLGHPYVGQSNDYGPLLVLLGFVLLGCARLRPGRWLAVAGWLAFVCGVLTFSRGLMIGLLFGLGLYAALARVPWKQVALFFGAGVAVAAIVALAASEFSVAAGDRQIELADIVESRLSASNVEARLEEYVETLRLVAERPLLGFGAGYFDRSHPDALVATHNAFLEQWKYFGVVFGSLSIACYLLVAAYFFRMRHVRPMPFYDAIACAWVFLLVTSLVQTFFEATTPRAVIYFMLGLCVYAPPLDVAPGQRHPRNRPHDVT